MTTLHPALAHLIEQVRSAQAAATPLEILGGGTKRFLGGPPSGEPLELKPLRGISSHEPTELVVTVRAGTPLAELEDALAQHGQCLAFEPPRFAPGGTVGGMVAAGLAGPARAAVGSVRDFVLGATVLNGRGELLTFGGQVMKNVAGYDLSRLMAGSMGVLAVLCEVSLKVLPRPAATATLQFELSEAESLAWLGARRALPWPVTATSWHLGLLRVRLAGAAAAVASAMQSLGGRPMEAPEADAWWEGVRDHRLSYFHGPGDGSPAAPLWRLCVPTTSPVLGLPGEGFVEWGGGLRWLRTTAPAAQVLAAAHQAGGHASLFRGSDAQGAESSFPPLEEPLLRIHRALKSAFDPQGVFNPGRLHPAL